MVVLAEALCCTCHGVLTVSQLHSVNSLLLTLAANITAIATMHYYRSGRFLYYALDFMSGGDLFRWVTVTLANTSVKTSLFAICACVQPYAATVFHVISQQHTVCCSLCSCLTNCVIHAVMADCCRC
jgi:hypothetical protein